MTIENTDIIKKRNIKDNSNIKPDNDIDNQEKINKQPPQQQQQQTPPPIILKKKRHPLITTLRYIAIFLIFFLLTNEYLIKFVHVEGTPLNTGKFSHINKDVLDPKDYNAIRIEYSPNYHEISGDYLYVMFRNKTQDKSNNNNNNNKDDIISELIENEIIGTVTTSIENNIINNDNDNNNNNKENHQTTQTQTPPLDESNLKIFKEYNELENYYANILNSNNNTYILFIYHMDCPFSQRLLPVVETLTRIYPNVLFFQSRGFTVILKTHFHTRTTPTLFIRVNDTLVKYKGNKNLNSIKKWISDNSLQVPIESIKPNPDIELVKDLRPNRGFLLYFSCIYVLFLILLSIYRWLKKYQKIKVD